MSTPGQRRVPPAVPALPPEIFNLFGRARPWVQVCGYMSLASAALALGIGFHALFTSTESGEVTSTTFFVQIILACMYLAPAILLLRYGHAMRGAARGRNVASVTEALRMQHRYWQFVGVLTTAAICVVVFLAVVAFGIPLMTRLVVR